MKQPTFATRLFDCDDASSLRVQSGSRFIRKLPDERSLGYLHKFYAPLPDGADAALLRRLPGDYIDFLKWANGAAFFDNSIALFGYVETITRNTEPEAVTAVSIANENDIFAQMEQGRWEKGWTKIGSLVGWDSTYNLQLHTDGQCAVVSDARAFTAPTFGGCMQIIISRIAHCFTCEGIIDDSYADLESALASLVHVQ